MKFPACKNLLREKGAGGMSLDVRYGGCGGIWFDASELERAPVGNPWKRICTQLSPKIIQ